MFFNRFFVVVFLVGVFFSQGKVDGVAAIVGNNVVLHSDVLQQSQLVEPVSAAPIDVGRVYVQIESLLIKGGQDEAKSVGVDGLLKKYTIIKNNSLLF